MDADHVDLLERSIGEAVVRVRADRAGLDTEQTLALLNPPRSNTRKISATGEETAENEGVRELRRMVPMVFMLLLWMGVFVSGQHLLMSTLEEKSNRVMEVLLSAVSPMQLMVGKIIGHGGVGLLITGIYSSLGLFALIYFAATHFIDPILFVYLGVYFFMAYFMISSLMAAVGGAVTDIREANTLMTPVMLIVMIPWFLWFPIIQDPNGLFATIISFVPPMTPFVMILRTSADEAVPFWQIPATIAWGYFCVIAMMWMASKIFRVGVLMYGKPPSFFQLLKWLRYS
jgi:ABC-2 type transport system permease protein